MKNKAIKTMIIVIICMTALISFCGCTSGDRSSNGDGKIRVVATIFPEYDWVREIMGDKAENADITLLMGNGVDMHSYQPTVDDILKISACDLFIYVGGESDEWVEDALEEATNKDMTVINLLETLEDLVKEEETVEGMEQEDEHNDEDEHDHESKPDDASEHDHESGHDDHHHSGEIEYDEHVWLSLNNASVICDRIAEALSKLDPENGDAYMSNVKAYKEKLAGLDRSYRDTVRDATVKTLLFGDRFPFRYMTDDYGLDYYAAFAGCSAETEASFETIVFLAGKVDELKLPTILTIENSDRKIAETIKENTTGKDQKILAIDSMQSVTQKDIESGTTYLSIMTDNLRVLKEALTYEH